ncbi:MAG: MMPL family transporter, partial [Lachnospiraceae bacterium]|nr:MMPL family transporter [Lachnospiraceae bacterium]
MRKLAEFIVDKRKFLLIIFIAAAIGSVIMSSHINVIQELTDYLPDDTETSIGLDVMDEQFTTFGTAKVMVQNVTYDQAKAIADQLKDIKGVSAVDFYEEDEDDENNDTEEKEFTNSEDMRDSYQDLAALYSISFETPEDDSLAQAAIADVRTALKDYDAWFYTTVDKDDAADLQDDMKVILVIAVIIIVGVLLFTSGTYMEIAIFMLVFGMAALLNMGTNFIFYNISFVTNAVATVLQLAMAIDYAIILFHRFMEEKGKVNTREALVRALEKGIPEISSSSLTTMAGMVALMFMQFGIGLDLGRVMIKAILLSMLSVFGFMPGLIMLWEKQIDRTLHKSFVPNIEFWGKIVLAIRHVTLPIFAIVMVVACFLSVNCNYVYDNSSVESAKMNEYMTAKREISKVFDLDNTLAVVVPKGDYDSEARIMEEVESLPMVDSTLGLANVTVDDDEQYVLTDSLTPQELADITDMDIDTIRLLYRFYAWKEEKYGAFLNSIDDFEIPLLSMIDFIYGEEENETFDFSADFSQDIQDMHKTVSDAREQLEGDEYSRMLVMTTGPIEGDEIFHTIDQIRDIAYQYYHEVYVVGDSTSDYDLSKSFTQDNLMVSIMTAVFVA